MSEVLHIISFCEVISRKYELTSSTIGSSLATSTSSCRGKTALPKEKWCEESGILVSGRLCSAYKGVSVLPRGPCAGQVSFGKMSSKWYAEPITGIAKLSMKAQSRCELDAGVNAGVGRKACEDGCE